MKKKFGYVGILLALLIGMVACSNDDTASGDDAGDESKTYNLKFGMVAGTAQNEYKAAEVLADYIETESDGQLTLDIYADSQLGDDRAMLEQVRENTLDITLAESGRFGIWVPRASLLGLPYIVEDFDHLKRAIYETDFGKELHEELLNEHNWKIAATAYNGTRQTTSNRAIEKLADMKDLKLRVPEADTLLDYAKFTGASPTPMAFTEVYLALQTGSVDGQENPLSTIDAQKFYEVQDYLALTNHVVNDANYVVSKDTWESLPEDLQTILQDGLDKAAEEHTKLFEEEEANLISKFEEEGVTVTEPDLAPFREAVSEAYPKYLEDIEGDGQAYLQQIEDAR
ncbi:Sialic acid-binding periplasmic protein SiaP precursor [Paraliobacillus sp. PM-2]|uniref:sialic acid TRAP transporter substrate-binding protein SiaP n=1 Tax=Paraliobacillus sp. PM-2 TaxID=1462524 RepID=UPI00061BCB2D|nr:sialic acid TRAP transporter substrate-binding protein SiaP [Paraliobacillus sp. PM-2]CQR47369.1 Sialic acid-binding periplasmic protein SiaP precursor [Paraliobacillus sp. PM-2]